MVERFLRYSLEHGRKITLILNDEQGMRRINTTVIAMDENSVTCVSGSKGKPKVLKKASILSAYYARGDEGDTLKNEALEYKRNGKDQGDPA